jgi:hypothetical protein
MIDWYGKWRCAKIIAITFEHEMYDDSSFIEFDDGQRVAVNPHRLQPGNPLDRLARET